MTAVQKKIEEVLTNNAVRSALIIVYYRIIHIIIVMCLVEVDLEEDHHVLFQFGPHLVWIRHLYINMI